MMTTTRASIALACVAIALLVPSRSQISASPHTGTLDTAAPLRLDGLNLPGRSTFRRFTQEVVGAYVVARFLADLGHSHRRGHPDSQAEKKQTMLISKAESACVASGRAVSK